MTEPTTFREAYDVLQRHAQELRNADEPNIDDLLSVVTESVAAYKVCKQRIDAVEAALKDALADVGAEASQSPVGAPGRSAETATSAATRPAAEPRRVQAPSASADDDVPF